MSTEKKSEKIVIVGFGWVGQANALALARMGFEVFYYDIVSPKYHYDKYQPLYENIKPLQTLNQIDGRETWYIVCIGDRVSEECHQDISLIEKALETLRGMQGKVILRSTILPKYLAKLPFHIYLPEFLHELHAVEECLNPFYFVIGSQIGNDYPNFLKQWEERACKIFKGTPEEASYVKYLSNIWNALRIAFVNEFGDAIAIPETEERKERVERIINFFFEKKSYLRYGKTFGGHCLPKDMRAFMGWKGETMRVPLLKAIYEANNLHQQVGDSYPLPQWFSEWDYASYHRGVISFFRRTWQSLNSLEMMQIMRHFFAPVVRFFEKLTFRRSAIGLKAKWDRLAKKNPYYYSNPDTKSWQDVDEFELRQSGELDYLNYVSKDDLVNNVLGSFQNKIVLEIGIGTGRMTEFFSKNFKEIHGIDISPIMLSIACKRLSSFNNIILTENEGNTIPYAGEYFDFVFSNQVFKHLPNYNLVKDYLKEIARVLKPDGLATVQLRTGTMPHIWRWFYGISFTPKSAQSIAVESGFQVLKTEVENNKSLWLWLKKI